MIDFHFLNNNPKSNANMFKYGKCKYIKNMLLSTESIGMMCLHY